MGRSSGTRRCGDLDLGTAVRPQLRQIQAEYAVLAGAILGYMIKR